MSPRDCALIAARAAGDKKGTDIIVQEIGRQIVVTDYFVIVSAANIRQVDAICESVEEALRLEAGVKPIGREGLEERSWVLLDYGDFVVHVFRPEYRDFYRLETLWNDAPIVDLVAAGVVHEHADEPGLAPQPSIQPAPLPLG
ncbi:MAG: ribosome silencing factor [Coriobacteriales bacterium]|jgi:ribosome-associated protein|nr:ribosome silencing factor [Coriobacteriales bacterium]